MFLNSETPPHWRHFPVIGIVLQEKRAEKLDAEVSRYRNQVAEMEYYKSRIEEMQQNCQLLTDTKALLEAQLESARKRADLVPILEGEITQFKLQLNNVAMESAAQREEVKDLLAENAQLTLDLQRYRTEMGCMSEDASTHSKSSGWLPAKNFQVVKTGMVVGSFLAHVKIRLIKQNTQLWHPKEKRT